MTDKAKRRIEHCSLTKGIGLDLSECEITDLSVIADLRYLVSLDITGNQISDLTVFSDLVNLTILDIGANEINNITALSALVNLTSLDIGYNHVSDLTPLSALVNLTSLDIRDNHVSDLTPLSTLVNLTSLDIRDNHVSDLTPLSALVNLTSLDISGSQISDLTPLSSLVNLTKLNISKNQISDLTPLANLIKLRTLNIQNNKINNLISLSNQINLYQLEAGYNEINDLKGLSQLINLDTLFLWNNQISDLTPLANLPNLITLYINDNQVTDIQPLLPLLIKNSFIVWENPFESHCIVLEGNPLKPSLIAAVKQGNQAVADYYEQLDQQGEEYIHEAKLMIVGEPRAGKTTLRFKLKDVNAILPAKEGSTKGVYIEQERIVFTTLDPLSKKPVPFHYNIWDFGGQDVYKPISQFFITRSSLYIAVINTDFNENDKDLMYWFETLEKLSSNSPVIVLVNTPTDREQKRNLTSIQARFANMWRSLHFVNLNKLITGSKNFDAQQLDAFNILRSAVHRSLEALPHRQDRIPKSWAAIRRVIADKATEKQVNGEVKPIIPYFEFKAICSENGINEPDQQARLCETLHILGVFLHYNQNELLSQVIILNNKWATDAAYTILDNVIVKHNKGAFNKKDITKIWSDTAYKGNQALLVELMKQFRLCYNIRDTDTYVVPHCLPLYDNFVKDWDTTENVRLIVQYDYLPLATIVQLLVGLHAYIAKDQRWIWQKGGVIEGDKCHAYNTQAYIEQSDEDKELRIRVRGKMTEQIMSTVLNELDRVNKPYPTLVIKKMIACNCVDCINSSEPTYFDYKKDLLRHLFEKNKTQIYCNNLADFVSINQLLRGVISAEQMRRDSPNNAYEYQNRRQEKVKELSPLDKAKELIRKAKIDDAIELLDIHFSNIKNNECLDALILLSGQLTMIDKKVLRGLEDNDAQRKEHTRIGQSLLNLINKADE